MLESADKVAHEGFLFISRVPVCPGIFAYIVKGRFFSTIWLPIIPSIAQAGIEAPWD
jgi:hypothetical protein